jgi:hypothetical protein
VPHYMTFRNNRNFTKNQSLFCTYLHEKKKSHTYRECKFTEYVKSFGQLYIFKNCLQTGGWFAELIVVNFSVKAFIDIAQQQCVFRKRC